MRYRHTQVGYLTIIALTFVLALIVGLMAIEVFSWIAFSVLIILGICLILFATLTVVIQGDALEIRFGPGLIRKKFHLKDIEWCQVVRNPWYYGWGIRLAPHGWLYSVSGCSAVEIRLKSGKKYRIGSDVPHELEKAVWQATDTTAK